MTVPPVELGLTDGDRVVVLGASGWFGRTTTDLLPRDVPVLAVASRQRDGFIGWDIDAVAQFAPTVVVNCAFLTPARLAEVGESEFARINQGLIDQFARTAELETVRAVLTMSSGAVVHEPASPYGRLKAEEEARALTVATPRRSVVIGRAYSLSGPFVRDPATYAFSDFIRQARGGCIRITADRPVLRRYTSARDFLAVCLMLGLQGRTGIVESGGELVEMGELARRIAAIVRPDARIERPAILAGEESVYASDDRSWQEACTVVNLVPLDLNEQIDVTQRGLPQESAR